MFSILKKIAKTMREGRMIIYKKLWKKMKEAKISQYKLHKEGISNSTITRLKRNEAVSTETIDRLCRLLKCDV